MSDKSLAVVRAAIEARMTGKKVTQELLSKATHTPEVEWSATMATKQVDPQAVNRAMDEANYIVKSFASRGWDVSQIGSIMKTMLGNYDPAVRNAVYKNVGFKGAGTPELLASHLHSLQQQQQGNQKASVDVPASGPVQQQEQQWEQSASNYKDDAEHFVQQVAKQYGISHKQAKSDPNFVSAFANHVGLTPQEAAQHLSAVDDVRLDAPAKPKASPPPLPNRNNQQASNPATQQPVNQVANPTPPQQQENPVVQPQTQVKSPVVPQPVSTPKPTTSSQANATQVQPKKPSLEQAKAMAKAANAGNAPKSYMDKVQTVQPIPISMADNKYKGSAQGQVGEVPTVQPIPINMTGNTFKGSAQGQVGSAPQPQKPQPIQALPPKQQGTVVLQEGQKASPYAQKQVAVAGQRMAQKNATEDAERASFMHKQGLIHAPTETAMNAYLDQHRAKQKASGSDKPIPHEPMPNPSVLRPTPTVQRDQQGAAKTPAKFTMGTDSECDPMKFASTQINLSGDAARLVFQASKAIDPDDLSDDGVETEPHVTVFYGLHDNEPDGVQRILSQFSCVKFKIGKPIVFEKPDCDVIVYEIEKTGDHDGDGYSCLWKMHDALANLPSTSKYPEYKPHATIAYVKKGKGKQYCDIIASNKDMIFVATEVVFSDRYRRRTVMPLVAIDRIARFTMGTEPHEAQNSDHDVHALFLSYLQALLRCQEAETWEEEQEAQKEADAIYSMLVGADDEEAPEEPDEDGSLKAFLSTIPDSLHSFVFMDTDGQSDEKFHGEWTRYEGPRGGTGWKNSRTGRVVYSSHPHPPGYSRRMVQASQERARDLGDKYAAFHRGEGEALSPEELHELAKHIQALPVHSLRNLKNGLAASWGNAKKRSEMADALTNHVKGLSGTPQAKEANSAEQVQQAKEATATNPATPEAREAVDGPPTAQDAQEVTDASPEETEAYRPEQEANEQGDEVVDAAPPDASRKWKKNEDGTYTAPNGTVWKKAAIGGEESPVNGKRYAGGALMPIHGKSKPSDSEVIGGDGGASVGQGGEMEKKPRGERKGPQKRGNKARDKNGRLVDIPDDHIALESLVAGSPWKADKLNDDALRYLGIDREAANAIKDAAENGVLSIPRSAIPNGRRDKESLLQALEQAKKPTEASVKAFDPIRVPVNDPMLDAPLAKKEADVEPPVAKRPSSSVPAVKVFDQNKYEGLMQANRNAAQSYVDTLSKQGVELPADVMKRHGLTKKAEAPKKVDAPSHAPDDAPVADKKQALDYEPMADVSDEEYERHMDEASKRVKQGIAFQYGNEAEKAKIRDAVGVRKGKSKTGEDTERLSWFDQRFSGASNDELGKHIANLERESDREDHPDTKQQGRQRDLLKRAYAERTRRMSDDDLANEIDRLEEAVDNEPNKKAKARKTTHLNAAMDEMIERNGGANKSKGKGGVESLAGELAKVGDDKPKKAPKAKKEPKKGDAFDEGMEAGDFDVASLEAESDAEHQKKLDKVDKKIARLKKTGDWKKDIHAEAEVQGIGSHALKTTAKMIREQDRLWRQQVKALIDDASKNYKHYQGRRLATDRKKEGFQTGDHNSNDWDVIAKNVASESEARAILGDDESYWAENLYELVKKGVPAPISEEEAYTQALNTMASQARKRKEGFDDERIPD